MSLPKCWVKINCGDVDDSWESWWEWALIWVHYSNIHSHGQFPLCFGNTVFCRHLSNGWCLQTPYSKSHQASKRPYLLHTAHCTLPIRCASRCTKNPVAFLARFCFQQYSLQEWCIHNEFHNSGHEITAPGSAGEERLLQHAVYWESQQTAETVMLEMLSQADISKI